MITYTLQLSLPIKDVFELLYNKTPCPLHTFDTEEACDEWRRNSAVLDLSLIATAEQIDAALGPGTALKCKKFFRPDLDKEM